MSKRFVIRMFGLSVILANCFFVLHLWHNASLATYLASKNHYSLMAASKAVTENSGWVYSAVIDTQCSLSEAMEYLGSGVIAVNVIFLVGIILCICPKWLVREKERPEDAV